MIQPLAVISAILISNILAVIIVMAFLRFARNEFIREQKKMLDRVDIFETRFDERLAAFDVTLEERLSEFKVMFDHWENWRIEHEKLEDIKGKTLVRAYDLTVTHTAQISELDRRVSRWENRELDKADGKKT